MKNIFLTLAMLFTIASFSIAQTTTPSAKSQTVHAKKDGTPDKRYKENRQSKNTVVVHKKKDGTPDKRYKENKSHKSQKN